MEMYVLKSEYKTLEKSLTRRIKELEKQLARSEKRLKQVTEDYNILLETATEHVTEESESND